MSATSLKPKAPKARPLPDGSHKFAGSFDSAKRWYPDPSFVVPGSFDVRSPSRCWPYSYLKHFYSKKYARLLSETKPDVYRSLLAVS